MLARVRSTGAFELLSAAAWARALGYSSEELEGKSLRALMELEVPDGGELVAALFDQTHGKAIDVTLRCKDERRKRVRLHRRFDPHEAAVFVIADER
jgi:PAS domain-containing protein